MADSSTILALDVGGTRVGVAVASPDVKIARPLTTLQRKAEDFWRQLQALVDQHGAQIVVIGLPRGLDGQETQQTEETRVFATEFNRQLPEVSCVWQDEAVTSVRAKEALDQRGIAFDKSQVDAVAASLILQDYITDQEMVR
ncbi:Holliday junction resolvase RuvX [Patescibacteria group bacterium]|nr:MAG: Holliday junction resolvase RuvX [Patescibacteria group bacterium]